MALCAYLTFSRGGALAAGAGLLVFFAFSPERVEKLATAFVAAAGSGAVILAAAHRPAIEQGLTNTAARHQGDTLLVSLVIVCAGVALAQTGVALAARHGTPPRWLTFSPRRARALCWWVPSRRAWWWHCSPERPARSVPRLAGVQASQRGSDSTRTRSHASAPPAATDATTTGRSRSTPPAATCSTVPARERSSCCGLRVPLISAMSRMRTRCTWRRSRRPASSGVVLLGGFFVLVLGATVRLSVRSRYEARVRAAGFAGAMFAFCVAAASDWIWQVPAFPAAFLVLAGAVLAPPHARSSGGASLPLRLGAIALAAAALVAIAVPLATVSTVRESQAAVLDGNSAQALADARTAVRLEPDAASLKSSWRRYSSSKAACPRRWPLPAQRRPTSRATGADG